MSVPPKALNTKNTTNKDTMSSIRYSFRLLYLCLVQIDDVHPHRLGFSASVERAALGLAVEESNQSARMRKHIIISSEQASIEIVLTQKDSIVRLVKNIPIAVLLPCAPPLILTVIGNDGNKFQIGKFHFQ